MWWDQWSNLKPNLLNSEPGHWTWTCILHKCVSLRHFSRSRLGKLWDLGAVGESRAHICSIQFGGSVVSSVEAPPPGARVHVCASAICIYNLTVRAQIAQSQYSNRLWNDQLSGWVKSSTFHGVEHSRLSHRRTQPLRKWRNIPPIPEIREGQCHTWNQDTSGKNIIVPWGLMYSQSGVLWCVYRSTPGPTLGAKVVLAILLMYKQ